MSFFNKSRNRGFTLVELLVVVSVIALLCSVTLVNLRKARINSRDTARKQDIAQMERGLMLYWNKYEQFPNENWCDSSVGSCGTACPCSPLQNGWLTTSAIVQGIVGNKIMASLPKDPFNNATYYYWYEPCCNQDCGGGRSCVNKGCCEYIIGANRLEGMGSSYSRWGRWSE